MNKFISKLNKPLHGGDITTAAIEFGIPEGEWIDLSTGINSTSYPNTHLSEKTIRMLPTAGNLDYLLNQAKTYYQVNQQTSIIASPGTQSLIQNLPIIFPNEEIYIVSPTYSEHRYTWEQAGNLVTSVNTFKEIPSDVIAIIVHPNNPDGRVYQKEDILELSKSLKLLVIDEAFCDICPEFSIIPHLSNNKILVLRSLGKFFGLAGLRLGFAVGTWEIIQQLYSRLGPWAVSGPAIEIGTRALLDNSWISHMQEYLYKQSSRLKMMLEKHQFSIIGKTNLFILISSDNASEFFQALATEGILVRRFEEYPKWIRIGLPGAENEWAKLDGILEKTLYSINNMGK
jgi:cobalamin biosynthetic protein CobC